MLDLVKADKGHPFRILVWGRNPISRNVGNALHHLRNPAAGVSGGTWYIIPSHTFIWTAAILLHLVEFYSTFFAELERLLLEQDKQRYHGEIRCNCRKVE